MELVLERQDLVQVRTISHTDTLGILPVGKKRRSKFVIGDDDGLLQCFEMKKQEALTVFSASMETKSPITAVSLAKGKEDRIFCAQEQSVVGIHKKGKQFFKLSSALTETIHHIAVEGSRIWTGCEYMYASYKDGNDEHFYTCHDRINALIVDRVRPGVDANSDVDVVLGCQDRSLRVVSGSDLAFEAQIDAPVTAVTRYDRTAADRMSNVPPRSVLYGTSTGLVGCMLIGASPETPLARQWVLPNTGKWGRVNCVAALDVTKDDVADVVVGRDDGRLQVFSFDADADGSPQLAFERTLGEGIHSVEMGTISTPGYDDVVCATYTGKVISFTNEPMDKATDDAYGRTTGQLNTENRIRLMRQELDALRDKVATERVKFDDKQTQFMPVAHTYEMTPRYTLDSDDACWLLQLELPMPIDLVTLQADVHVDLLDVDASQAIVSRPTPTPGSKTVVLATYRCQETVNRVTIKMRTMEGETGEIGASVVAAISPKTAHVLKFHVKPLSLHHRTHKHRMCADGEPQLEDRKLNLLEFDGDFSLSQVHEWVVKCLPEVPPRLESREKDVTMYFRNVFTGSCLIANYSAGKAAFQSDSVSTLYILKEQLSDRAMDLRLKLRPTDKIDDGSIECFLGLIDARLKHVLSLAQDVELIEAIKEVEMQEPDSEAWLSASYSSVLKNADSIRAEHKDQPRALQYLSGIVTDLFVDFCKFKGRAGEGRHRIPELQQLILTYDFATIVAFFKRES